MTDDVSISNRIEEKWDEIKQIVRKECCLTNISYGTWIEPLEFLVFHQILQTFHFRNMPSHHSPFKAIHIIP